MKVGETTMQEKPEREQYIQKEEEVRQGSMTLESEKRSLRQE